MSMRTLRWPAVVLVAAVVAWTTGQARGIGFILGESKEQLKLKYDVTVHDHGTGRVTLVLTLADEGRLKPLDEVELASPGARRTRTAATGWTWSCRSRWSRARTASASVACTS